MSDCSDPIGRRLPKCFYSLTPVCKWCSNDAECGRLAIEIDLYQWLIEGGLRNEHI